MKKQSVHEKIESALMDAIKYHNDGLGATDSIVKSASAHELNPETICRVVEAFNIAKTKAHIKKAEQKDSDFDTADKQEAINKVFSINKKAAETIEYRKENDSFSISRKSEPLKKVAEEFVFEKRAKDLYEARDVSRNEIAAKRLAVTRSEAAYYDALSKIATQMSLSYEKDSLEDNLDKIAYEYGQDQTAFEIVDELCKIAKICYTYPTNPTPSRLDSTKFFTLFGDMFDAAEEFKKSAEEYNQMIAEFSEHKDEMEQHLLSGTHGVVKNASSALFSKKKKLKTTDPVKVDKLKRSTDVKLPEVKEEKQQTTNAASLLNTKIATEVGTNVKTILGEVPIWSPPSAGKLMDDYAQRGIMMDMTGANKSVEKTEVDIEMQNVKRHAILRDLMVNDEIISEYDPKIVADAYNTMIQLSPRASLVPDIARSVLRYATAQSIDPHYASQLVELENNLIKQKNPEKEKK